MKLAWEKADCWERELEKMVRTLQKDAAPLILWGDADPETLDIFLTEKKLTPDAICDIRTDISSRYLCGQEVRIISPDKLENEFAEYNALIVVPYKKKLTREINCLKKKPNNIFYLDMARTFLHKILFTKPDRNKWETEEMCRKIDLVKEMLEDEASVDTFERMLQYWVTGEYHLVEKFCELQAQQYLDVFQFTKDEVFLNVGACDGRYTKRFVDQVGSYKAIYNMECDPINYNILQTNMKHLDNCFNYNIGAWNKYACLKFRADGNAGSCLAEDGNELVELDSLDRMFGEGGGVTFIKADIEGAEYKMLEGATGIIKRYAPKLAICCYHQMDDLIEIPMMIKNLNSSYKIKMRHYTDTLTETVCYAYVEN